MYIYIYIYTAEIVNRKKPRSIKLITQEILSGVTRNMCILHSRSFL